jgi:hypothetical protein
MMKFVLCPLLLGDQIKEEVVGVWVICHTWESNAYVILDWKPGPKEII